MSEETRSGPLPLSSVFFFSSRVRSLIGPLSTHQNPYSEVGRLGAFYPLVREERRRVHTPSTVLSLARDGISFQGKGTSLTTEEQGTEPCHGSDEWAGVVVIWGVVLGLGGTVSSEISRSTIPSCPSPQTRFHHRRTRPGSTGLNKTVSGQGRVGVPGEDHVSPCTSIINIVVVSEYTSAEITYEELTSKQLSALTIYTNHFLFPKPTYIKLKWDLQKTIIRLRLRLLL